MTGPALPGRAREAVLRHLSTPHAEHRFNRAYLVAAVLPGTGGREHEVWEALWGLVGDGLVYLDPAGQGSGTDNWQWKLSSAGIRAVTGGPWEPADPAGYLRRLRAAAPDLDPLAVRYVEEALRAFAARCYLASSVMLGVASEQAFTGLAEAFAAAQGDRAESLRKLLASPGSFYSVRFREFRKRLEPIRGGLPPELVDVLTLDAVGDLLRVTRNAAGHPTGQDIDEDTARTHLQMAAVYLRKMTDLRLHFDREAGRGSRD